MSFNFNICACILKPDFSSVVVFLAEQAGLRLSEITMIFWLHIAFADLWGELLASDDLVVTVG